jgi:hypothetical protein
LIQKARESFDNSVVFGRALNTILYDTKFANEIPFEKKKKTCYDLIRDRTNLARSIIADVRSGKPIVSPASFALFEDDICGLIKLYSQVKKYMKLNMKPHNPLVDAYYTLIVYIAYNI